MHAKTVKK